jgi:hypothetical protein
VLQLSKDRLLEGAFPQGLGLQRGGQLMGQLRRNEAGLLHRQAVAAMEEHMALGIWSLDSTGIDTDCQLADLAVGKAGGHHEAGEGHPRQASAAATRQDLTETAHPRSLLACRGIVSAEWG